jgi:glycosyltransferase involved in cell wall biosynthesis
MLSYLKCCAASIADQKDAHIEHIVVDAKSTDGTVDWLSTQSKIRYISEPDNGMYDAVNKGLKMASGDILAYLNCDEQYLPGTLAFVKEYFETHPNVDLVFGHALIIDKNGGLLSFRKSYRPSYTYIITSILYNLSCTMFFRRNIIEHNIYFNEHLKDVADADFVLKILGNKYNSGYIKEYLSVFTWTGNNMSVGHNARMEARELKKSAQWYMRYFSFLYNIARYVEKLFSGGYFQKFPIRYDIYIPSSQQHRRTVEANSVSSAWPKYPYNVKN